jgi:hypothetical protein
VSAPHSWLRGLVASVVWNQLATTRLTKSPRDWRAMDEDALVLNLVEDQPAQVPRPIRRRVGVDTRFGFIEAMRAVLVNL